MTSVLPLVTRVYSADLAKHVAPLFSRGGTCTIHDLCIFPKAVHPVEEDYLIMKNLQIVVPQYSLQAISQCQDVFCWHCWWSP